jgi:hypothetical protein
MHPAIGEEAVTPEKNVSSLKAWQRTISDTYYQQDVRAQPGRPFEAAISVIDLGDISLSRIVSSPVIYRRRTAQISAGTESYHLVTVPLAGELVFDQQDSRFPLSCKQLSDGAWRFSLRTPSTEQQRTSCCKSFSVPA